jgi:GNAT superfamily N-acetyltransferase
MARCSAIGQPVLNKPGLYGGLSSADHPLTRLLITGDHANDDELAALLPAARAGVINIFAAAKRCAEFVDGHVGWRSKAATAMICRDLRTVPEVALPKDLTLRPVRRLSDDGPDGVPLEDAVAVAVLADPAGGPPAALAEYLRSLPPAFQFFAAVSDDGAVHATSGFGLFGSQTNVIFVNIDPDWQLRGVGRAMTAAALRAAQDAGARQACLDASHAGLSIYRRLGFETVAQMTRFSSRP